MLAFFTLVASSVAGGVDPMAEEVFSLSLSGLESRISVPVALSELWLWILGVRGRGETDKHDDDL